MTCTAITRGSTVFFSSACKDAAGAPAVPTGGTLYLSFVALDGTLASASIAMTPQGSNLLAQWDSAVARPGVVNFSVRAQSGNTIATDGQFNLVANSANPA